MLPYMAYMDPMGYILEHVFFPLRNKTDLPDLQALEGGAIPGFPTKIVALGAQLVGLAKSPVHLRKSLGVSVKIAYVHT